MTLVELMVVLAILSIMLGATAISLNDGGKGRSVGGAVPMVAGALGDARNQALTSGRKVRLVIDSVYDATRPDNYLRRYMLMRDSGDGATWEQITKPASLPKGVFYSTQYSVPTGKMNVKLSMQGDQYYYEFDESGQLSPASGGSNSARLVVTAGIVQNGVLVVPDGAKDNHDGVLIHRLGRVAYYQNPAEISEVAP